MIIYKTETKKIELVIRPGVALTGLLDVDFAGVAFDGLFEADLAGVAGLLDELFAGVVAGVFLDALNKSDRLFLSDAGVLFLTGLFEADRAGVSVLAGCQPTGMVTNTQVYSLIFFTTNSLLRPGSVKGEGRWV